MALSAQDPAFIPPFVLACALLHGEKTLQNRIATGVFPEPDHQGGRGNEKLWSLNTIRRHNPALADRVLRVLAALEAAP